MEGKKMVETYWQICETDPFCKTNVVAWLPDRFPTFTAVAAVVNDPAAAVPDGCFISLYTVSDDTGESSWVLDIDQFGQVIECGAGQEMPEIVYAVKGVNAAELEAFIKIHNDNPEYFSEVVRGFENG
jgi:hypothetical protein